MIFGISSGVVAIVLMLATLPYIQNHDSQKADIFGYASMVLSALLVFFGIRSYREKESDGRLTYGRGLLVGVLITLVSWACFSVAFELIYFWIVPDYGEKFAACMVERARESGGTPADIDKARSQAAMFRRLWDNPLTNAALTLATLFPVGFAAAAVSAAILRRR
jgi:hypothetical protein